MLLVVMAVAMMTTTDRLAQLINKLNKSWRRDAKKAVAYLQRLIASGMKFEEALDNVQRHYGKLFTLPELKPALVEAAAYAYGIVPTMLTKAQVESMGEELADKWDESGMTLSEKLHGVGVKMRGAIVSTLQEQMRRNKTWTEAARALYDGYGDDGQNVYNGGKDIISRQDLPKYLQKVRVATGNDLQALAEQRQAIDNINRLAKNGAPNKALQAAYNKLLEAVQKGNEKAIEKAVEVAVNEKSRYVAERITRTEMARAWADGFIAKMQKDADIVAVKFKLSSRHPVFDICDMYAKADMYGLGAGIYPKDKLPPLPVHPHCLCRYVEVIEGEVDMQQQRDQVREAGDKWLNSLPESRRAQVLGRKGLKAWEDGEDWQGYMRGYAGLREAESRLQLYKPVELSEKTITDEYQSPKGSIKKFQTRKVKNAAYDIHVSENVNLKPKMLAEVNRQINKCIDLLGVRNKEALPKIVIASNDDLNDALGSYVACENKLYINSETLHRKAYEKYLATLKNPASRNPLMTMLHEMIHWQDARKYVAKFGEITQQDEYMAHIIEKHRIFVDKLVQKRYNFAEISDYASRMYIGGRYDEVMTEYRVKKLLG
jgi:histone H3/H4